MKELARTLKALSEETRLEMIALLLTHEELCVCDFVETLGLTQSKTSRHLRYLHAAGLVDDRREGLWVNYRLSSSLSKEQEQILEAVSLAIGDERKRALDERLRHWLERKAQRRDSAQKQTS